ncbi:MAG TPA: molybdenum cofactor biosynthesis protein MoaE [Candidatus Limnocylindria bacterium]|jgi:molybdopterin synthase catalytic subunit
MRVTVRTFAILRELAGDRASLELAEGCTLADAWRAMERAHPALAPHREFVRGARNGAYAPWDQPLSDGDEVAFLPPVSGGGPTGLTDGPLDVPALEASVAGLGHGALVTFVGRARDRSDDGRQVVELEYEVYPEMAEAVLQEIAGEAEARWPGVVVAVVHRTGIVPIGQAAVAIVAAAPHRSDAYDANRFVIEGIKERLPIWKRERFVDGSEWKRPGA